MRRGFVVILSNQSVVRYGVRRGPERSWLDRFTASNYADEEVRKPAKDAGTEKTRVMVAEDHPVIREGLSTVIAGHEDMEVSAHCATGQEAIDRYLDCKPDVALIGLRSPAS